MITVSAIPSRLQPTCTAPHSPLDHGPQLKCSEFVLRLSDFFLGGLLFIKSAFFGCVLYARECTKYISLFSQTL